MNKDHNTSLVGTGYPVAGLLCLFGFFLHIFLSDPVLDALGFHYAGDEGAFFEKIHPGTYFIALSFFVLLLRMGNLLQALLRIFREYPAALLLLTLYVILFAYLVVRSGPAGTAFIIDTHMMVPAAAIVLCYTPPSLCRKAVWFFLLIVVVNSLIGLGEGFAKTRLLTFDPAWSVLHEEHFRASALFGHPLLNATVTVIAMFVAVALRLPAVIKAFLILLFTASLVAFGGRMALGIGLCGLSVLGLATIKRQIFNHPLTMQRIFGLMALVIIVPLAFVILLSALLQSGLGERLVSAAHWDDSANSRLLAFHALHYMSGEEIVFGMSGKRFLDITDRINLGADLGSIENPWLIMFMYLGLLWFPVWLAATAAFAVLLIRHKPFALQLAVLVYFAIASTFNSFATKEATYLIMVCAVLCAARSLPQAKSLS